MPILPLGKQLPSPRRNRMALGCLLIGLVLPPAVAADQAAAANDSYRLRPQTHIKVTIVEWVASTGEYKEWSALNGEYSVSPLGTISIPLLGEIVVADDTTSGVAERISRTLKDKTGLSAPPVATVEVVRYPMIYVTGVVDRPGEMEFKPGLTAMQAVAMAGGRERKSNPTGYSELEQIRYLGELNRYELLLKQLIAKRARLDAEMRDLPTVNFPKELARVTDETTGRPITESENSLFIARAEALKHQLESLDELQSLLQNEIKVLEEKTVVQDRQIKIAQDELSSIASLVDTGTLARSRETSLERVVADLSSDKLDLVVAAMRAKQKLSETQRDALTLKGDRRTQAGRDLQEVEAEIEDTKLKRNTTMQLLEASGASVSRYKALEATALQPVEYWVTRKGDVRSPFRIQQTAALEPGDVLDVRYDVSAAMAGPVELSTDTGQSQ